MMETGLDVSEPDDGEPEDLAVWLAAGFQAPRRRSGADGGSRSPELRPGSRQA